MIAALQSDIRAYVLNSLSGGTMMMFGDRRGSRLRNSRRTG
jgi:hypothetical protein